MNRIIIIYLLLLSYVTLNNQIYAQSSDVKTNQTKTESYETRKIESQEYEKAFQTGTLKALKDYLNKYPDGIYKDDIKDRIAEFELWSFATYENTHEAYSYYIENTSMGNYIIQAEDEIKKLQAMHEWESIKTSESVELIQAFINKNPGSHYIADAEKRICELNGISFFHSGDLREAYLEFEKAGGKYALSPDNQIVFDQCEEFAFFSSLSPYSDERELRLFLVKYPSGKYSNDVSNYLAIHKAEELTRFSNEEAFKEVRALAKDEATQEIVNEYIKSQKVSFKSLQNINNSPIETPKGSVQWGFYFVDVGVNTGPYSLENIRTVMYWNVGFSLKFGNHKQPFQFEFGLKPGFLIYNLKEISTYDDTYLFEDFDTSFRLRMPLFTRLKYNLFNTGDNSKFYLSVGADWNMFRNKKIESAFATSLGCGFTFYNLDLGFYYKMDINPAQSGLNRFIGASFAIYF